jgi:integrase
MAFNPHKTRNSATSAWPVVLDSLKLPRLHPNGYYYLHFRRQDEATGASKADMETTRSRTEAGAAEYMRGFIEHHKTRNPGSSTPVPTVAKITQQYLDTLELEGPRRAKAQASALARVLPILGGLQPGQIDQTQVDRFMARRAPRTSGTMRRELAALKTVLRWGADRKLFPRADLHVFKLPPDSKPRIKFLDRATEARVQLAAGAIFRDPGHGQHALQRKEVALFLLVALNTAARKGAILDLEWERIDFATNEIDFRDPRLRETKKRRAVVPILSRLKPTLEQAHREACARWDDGVARGRVFAKRNVNGEWSAFKWLADELGVPWMTPHVCRHTWATLALGSKKPALAVAGMMADTLATLDRNYAHATKALLHETFT